MSESPIDLQALAFTTILIGELRAQLEAAQARIRELEAQAAGRGKED
jgi:hypothetical protein